MSDLMGLIYTGEKSSLGELTTLRAVAAVPICGRYRVIDFALSSMVNSGIRNVGLIVQRNYHSLTDHLGSGKEWNLHGKRQGLIIMPPYLEKDNVGVYTGLLDAIKSNGSYLRRSRERYVLVTDTGMIYTARYEDMLEQHIRTGADITLMYTTDRHAQRTGNIGRYLNLAEDSQVTDLEIQPAVPSWNNTYMEAFLIRRELLIELADNAIARGQYHFTRDLLLENIRSKRLKVYGWKNPGRVWRLDTVQSYFNCSMDLLDTEIRSDLFAEDRPIWTKQRDEMPTRYSGEAQVKNSLLADGCIIEGTVENSILFRGVRVQRGAVVRNAIIMQDGYIMSGAHLECCILDKQVIVRDGVQLITPRDYPIVISKGTIL